MKTTQGIAREIAEKFPLTINEAPFPAGFFDQPENKKQLEAFVAVIGPVVEQAQKDAFRAGAGYMAGKVPMACRVNGVSTVTTGRIKNYLKGLTDHFQKP